MKTCNFQERFSFVLILFHLCYIPNFQKQKSYTLCHFLWNFCSLVWLINMPFFPQGNGTTLYATSIKQNLYDHNWNSVLKSLSSLSLGFGPPY